MPESEERRATAWVLAIDFGTSSTVAAVALGDKIELVRIDGDLRMPSMVFWREQTARTPGTLILGSEAENWAAADPACLERAPKRRLGDVTFRLGDQQLDVVETVGKILRRAANAAIEQRGGTPPRGVCLTFPVRWGDDEREQLLAAAAQAGLRNVSLIEEPIAAAVHFGSAALLEGQHVAVYDLGGGTFDTAILRRTAGGFEIVGEPGGNPDIGGEEFDDRLYRYLTSRLDGAQRAQLATSGEQAWRQANRQLQREVRRAKEALSGAPDCPIYIPPPIDRQLIVTVRELEELILEPVAETVDELARTIADADLASSDLAGIYLAGGSSRIPLITRMIDDRLGMLPKRMDDPKAVVVLGAARAEAQSLLTGGVPRPAPDLTEPTPIATGAPTFSATEPTPTGATEPAPVTPEAALTGATEPAPVTPETAPTGATEPAPVTPETAPTGATEPAPVTPEAAPTSATEPAPVTPEAAPTAATAGAAGGAVAPPHADRTAARPRGRRLAALAGVFVALLAVGLVIRQVAFTGTTTTTTTTITRPATATSTSTTTSTNTTTTTSTNTAATTLSDGSVVAPASLATSLSTIPPSVYDRVPFGFGGFDLGQEKHVGTSGNTVLLFAGDESCPYCEAISWPLAIALSRFGSLSGLSTINTGTFESFDHHTPGFSFLGAHYTSPYLTLNANEQTGNQGQKLESLSAFNQSLYNENTPNGPPFIDFGGRYVIAGPSATFTPSLLDGQTYGQIVAALQNPSSTLGEDILGEANALTANICLMTGNAPSSVCNDSVIQDIEQSLPK